MPSRSEFTEFTYGFALTREYLSFAGGLVAAPVLPSLKSEGQVGGYDVMLRFRRAKALFLQFKLAERVDHPRGGQWSLFNAPYYRFWIWPRNQSRQHELLVTLARTGRVLYSAPSFLQALELNQAFMGRTVRRRSAMFSPADIGSLRDDDWHCVAFTPGASYGWFCSDPVRVRNLGGEASADTLRAVSSDRDLPDITEDNSWKIASDLERDAVAATDQRPGEIRQAFESGVDLLAHVASTYYSAHLLLVGESSEFARGGATP